jgi:hypothetical protein
MNKKHHHILALANQVITNKLRVLRHPARLHHNLALVNQTVTNKLRPLSLHKKYPHQMSRQLLNRIIQQHPFLLADLMERHLIKS